MKYEVLRMASFRKDVKRLLKRGKDLERLLAVVDKLANDEPLDDVYRDHALSGDYIGFRECHVKADWVLVYRKNAELLTLTLLRTGTHSDIF